MHAGVARSVVDEQSAVIVSNGAVRKHDVAHVANAFVALQSNEVTAWTCNHFRWVFETCHKCIDNVAETGRSVANTVCYKEPAFLRLDRYGTSSVLHILYRVVNFFIDN